VYVPNVNEGYPGGNVTGVRYAKGNYVMITNPDTTLEKDTIERLIRDFLHRPDNVMVLVPKILIRESDVINSIGMRKIRPSENLYTNIGYLEHDHGQFDTPRRVEAFDGSAFIFRRELAKHTYLFDPRYFFGSETVDLAERMTKLGLVAYTCPSAVVRHQLRGSVTSTNQNDRITAIIVRNALIHTLQNTDLAMFLRTLIIGICFRNILGRIVTGHNRRLGVTYIRGLAMFVTQLGKYIVPPLWIKEA
jgi:GT2 family glycosyltransferase